MIAEVTSAAGENREADDDIAPAEAEASGLENRSVTYEAENQEVIYVPVVEKCSLHETALNILMEIFQTKNKGVVLGSSELMLRTIHIIALGLRGTLRHSMNEAISTAEKLAKGVHVGLKPTDIVNLMLTRTYKGNETKLFREKYAAKFHMSWAEYSAMQNAPDPAAVSPEEVLPQVHIREADDDTLFYRA